MRKDMVMDAAFMEKIYKQVVTHIYWRKHQSFRSFLVEFREDPVCFKSIPLFPKMLSLHHTRGFTPPPWILGANDQPL